ncbi:Fc.00g075480.m01.CDS01 [Cosmosporella sp. VM-42]
MVAPTGYFVQSSPNIAENGTYSCPHQGCGGRSFGSVGESHQHHDDWHAGPYQCAECGQNFAAAPALDRHLGSTHHKKEWVCTEMECELGGVEFPTRAAYQEHVVTSTTRHKKLRSVGAVEDTLFVEVEEEEEEEGIEAIFDCEDIATTPTREHYAKEFACHEECCRKFGFDFRRKSEYNRHVDSVMHICGISFGKRLRCQVISPELLEAELDAIRSLRCNAESCSGYDKKFGNIRAYVSHLGTAEHRCENNIDLGNMDSLEDELDVDMVQDLHCSLRGCPREGYVFRSRHAIKQHFISEGHLQAIGEVCSLKTDNAVSTPKQTNNGLLSPLDLWVMPTPASPRSPSTGREPRFALKTPTRTRRVPQNPPIMVSKELRMATLENENSELRGRIERLEDRVRMLSMSLTK